MTQVTLTPGLQPLCLRGGSPPRMWILSAQRLNARSKANEGGRAYFGSQMFRSMSRWGLCLGPEVRQWKQWQRLLTPWHPGSRKRRERPRTRYSSEGQAPSDLLLSNKLHLCKLPLPPKPSLCQSDRVWRRLHRHKRGPFLIS